MDDKIPEGLEDLLKGIIEDDEKIPEGLDDLLDSVRDTPEPPGALATVPKKSDDLVDEEIDSQILSILELEDVFDLTYEEYASLLKEAAVKGRMTNSQMTTESIELVTNEFKRVKGKTGKFKVKPKKVDINKVLNRKPGAIVKVDNLKQEDKESEAAEDKSDSGEFKKDVNDGINKILGSLITIKSVLDKQKGIEESTAKRERRTEEKREKSRRENKLEKKKEDKKKTKKLPEVKPIGGFFDMIKRFFTNILIGATVLKIFKWMNDPENKSSIERFKNFMVDNAPLILGGLLAIAALPLASTLLGLTVSILSGVGTLIGALGSLGAVVGGLIGIAAAGATAFLLPKVLPESVNAQERKTLKLLEEKYSGDKKKMIEDLKKEKKSLSFYDRNIRGMGSEIEEQIRFLETGKTSSYGQKGEDAVIEELRKRGVSEDKLKLLERIRDIDAAPGGLDKFLEDSGLPSKEEIEKITKDIEEKTKNQAPTSQPSTPLVPKPSGTPGALPPSASNTGSVIEYITGDAGHPNFEYEGHGTTSNYHDHIAFKTIEDKERAKAALRSAGIQIGSESRPWDTDSYHSQGLAIDIPGAQWGGRGAIGETEYAGSRKVRAVLAAAGFSGGGIDTSGSVRAPSPSAQIARKPVSAPSISSPTGRSGIGILPMPMGGGGSKGSTSGSGAGQTKLPFFSSEDPNNMTMMVVKGIYNVVG